MSLRIAVALAAIIGAGVLGTTNRAGAADVVGFRGDYSPGTIVVKTNERRLYLVLDPEHAVRYPVGVGKSASNGPAPPGSTANTSIRLVAARRSEARQAGNSGCHSRWFARNPMGVAAMTLSGGEYAIHGTNMPGSVGGFVSYGCIRMLNPISPTFISAFPSARR